MKVKKKKKRKRTLAIFQVCQSTLLPALGAVFPVPPECSSRTEDSLGRPHV